MPKLNERLVDALQAQFHINRNKRIEQGLPVAADPDDYVHQEYPKTLYHMGFRPLIVSDEDQETAALNEGFQETPVLTGDEMPISGSEPWAKLPVFKVKTPDRSFEH